MPWIIATIAGLSSFGSGALSSKSKRKERHKRSKRLKKAISATEAIQGMGLQQQEALARQATGQRVAGFDAAKREASRLGRGAKQRALDREGQLGASLSQNLTSSGLGSTTRGANLQRGITADTSRVLGGIDEGLAGLFGDLELGRADAEATGTQQLAGLAGERANLMSSLRQMGLLGGQQLGQFDIGPWSQPNLGENAMTGLQTGLGSFMGMGGGAGGGQGGMNPELMRMIQQLFSQQQMMGRSNLPPAGSGYYNTFT